LCGVSGYAAHTTQPNSFNNNFLVLPAFTQQLRVSLFRVTLAVMQWHTGRVKELRSDGSGDSAAWIACPPGAVPGAGRYLLAVDGEAVLPHPLFLSEIAQDGFLAASGVPANWAPGTLLRLRGPLGQGFSVPEAARRLALAALGLTSARLLPLADLALRRGVSVALFCDGSPPPLPAAVEINPLNALPEALSWADFLALDLPLEMLPGLRASLGLDHLARLSCPGQVLVFGPMPCGGLADCGVCAVPVRRGYLLACKDGPVVDLKELLEGHP